MISIKGEFISHHDFSPQPAPGQVEKLKEMLLVLEKADLTPPAPRELWQLLGIKKEEGEALLDYLLRQGEVVKAGEDYYLHHAVVERCLQLLRQHFSVNRSVTLAQYRDLLQGSRKHSQVILEYFDGCKYTRRLGDERVPWKFPT